MTSRAAASTVIHREDILMIFGIKGKIYNFDPYNVFLAIATNIPVWLKTGFVVQGHVCVCVCVCVTLDHKTCLKSHWYICSNSQKYIVWVKIIDFSFYAKNHKDIN